MLRYCIINPKSDIKQPENYLMKKSSSPNYAIP